jgi:FKBP-type peptidyl-prolyl cis-trans isomerase 2
VPDIYKKATVKDGWIELATDLKVGDRVKLISQKEEAVHEVLEVSEGAFRPDGNVDADSVFVYGREVNDFRTVDYDAIAMLNVSATQEIKREKDAEIDALKTKNAELEARLSALEKRFAAK